jgi:phage terminase large subunit
VGHGFVKRLFVDRRFRETENPDDYVFIKSLVTDNHALMESDPEYVRQLESLPPKLKKAWLHGDWDIFEGQYFTEFSREKHVIEPFEIPASWRKYRTLDYGLDRLAVLWIAVAPDGRSYVYREYCESSLPIGEAAEAILKRTPVGEDIYATLAPPDMWSRSQESGKTKAGLFSEYGVNFTKTSNDRECGWLAIKELLRERHGDSNLKIFSSCTEIIKCLPALSVDKIRPTDCATEPHELTHAPDALRGFAIFHSRPGEEAIPVAKKKWTQDMWEDYYTANEEGKNYLIRKYGEPT